MREWIRLTGPLTLRCGNCGALFADGDALQRLTKEGQTWRLYRCETCVGSPAPPPLPAQVKPQEDVTKRMQAIGRVAVQFQRPEPKPLKAVPKKRAYRGDPPEREVDLYDDHPRYDR